jgi:pimeloyl-ACP methyl ester carboxylesterase
MAASLPPFEDRLLRVNGVNVRTRSAGNPAAPLALLLHGFPETWMSWREQIPALLAAGWRVALPDQRGYATSSKPTAKGSFERDKLVGDALGLIDALDAPTAAVIGHGWGGVVGWTLAAAHPTRVSHLVAIAAPHPAVAPAFLKDAHLPSPWGTLSQLSVNAVPEWILSLARVRALNGVMAHAKPGSIPDADLRELREEWIREGAWDAMMGWFREAARAKANPADSQRVTAPTLILWGANDRLASPAWAQASQARADGAVVEVIADAGHFVQHEAPEAVNAAILGHLGTHEIVRERSRPRQW